MTATDHGRASTYQYHRCRCTPCTRAARIASAAARARMAARLRADPTIAAHGRRQTYIDWGCRCDPCRAATAAYVRARREARRAAR